MLSYHAFREDAKGRAIAALTATPSVIDEMERRSRAGEPAVAAIDAAVADTIGDLDDVECQHAGRVVRDALTRRGWFAARRKRVRGGRVFTSGAVYEARPEPRAPVDAVESPAARFARVRDAIAAAGVALGSVDDLIADRRREAKRETSE